MAPESSWVRGEDFASLSTRAATQVTARTSQCTPSSESRPSHSPMRPTARSRFLLIERLIPCWTHSGAGGRATAWEPEPGRLKSLAGLYLDPLSGETHEVETSGGKVSIGLLSLEAVRQGVLGSPKMPGLELRIDPGLRLRQTAVLERPLIRRERWNPVASQLNTYAGAFWSDELATRWTVTMKGDALVIEQSRWGTLPLTPTITSSFAFSVPQPGGDTLRFDIHFTDEQEEFFASTGRVHHLRFRRVTFPRAGEGSPRLSGLGSFLVSVVCRSKAGSSWLGSVACRKVTVRDGLGACGGRVSVG